MLPCTQSDSLNAKQSVTCRPFSRERPCCRRLQGLLVGGTVAAAEAATAETGAADSERGDRDALVVVEPGDEVAAAVVAAVVVLEGEPGVGEGVGLDGHGLGLDGGVTGGQAVEDLLGDLVLAGYGVLVLFVKDRRQGSGWQRSMDATYHLSSEYCLVAAAKAVPARPAMKRMVVVARILSVGKRLILD